MSTSYAFPNIPSPPFYLSLLLRATLISSSARPHNLPRPSHRLHWRANGYTMGQGALNRC
jgi:hypothetical protein